MNGQTANQSIQTSSHILYVSVMSLLAILVISIFYGCTSLNRHLSMEPMGPDETGAVIAYIQDQEDRISSFITSGTVSIEAWMRAPEADILIFGTRDPFRLKIEITHPWGGRILHILIEDTKLEVLSFDERTQYIGTFTPYALSRFLPGLNLDKDLVWSVSRGYPILMEYSRFVSFGADQIILLDHEGTQIEIINLLNGGRFPREVLFPIHDINIDFSTYEEINGIYYAQEVKVDGATGNKELVLKYKKMVFNTAAVSAQDFTISPPPGFGKVYLD